MTVIAKSDLFILIVSGGALALGLVRWQGNLRPAGVATSAPAPSAVTEAAEVAASAAVAEPAASAATTDTTVTAAPASDLPSVTVLGAIDTQTQPDFVEVPVEVITEAIEVEDNSTAASAFNVYRVQNGDFLGGIAQRFGTDVATLREINELESSVITIGQQLRVPTTPAN